MNPLSNILLHHGLVVLLALSTGVNAAEDPPKAIHSLALDEHRVYAVPVSVARVTTVSFPSSIAAIDAALVSTDDKTQGLFQLAHQPGTAFFSVRSLIKDATTNVNVRWNNKTYVLELKDSAAPVLSLIFQTPPDPRLEAAKRQQPVTPVALLALLDTAKAYPVLKASQPLTVKQVIFKDYRPKPPIMDHGHMQILLEEAFRFDVQDTLVFRVTIRNTTEKELRYDPGAFVLKVGERRFNASISDASGTIPPKKDAVAYFAVTGTPDGGRNDLSVENDFVIVLDSMASPGVLPELKLPSKGGSK
ncbi:hypothetical protein GCM10023213_32310 [Prosthecobacter algae]|jgi:hypothetical protein|uniref:Uncharacterized protein n=1 Tax=Prosthecobacter algae TaxID=1144682 RepID=A0ABP9PB59_9BACT